MGNGLSFITKHGRRLKNRYNAQYRAIEVISKENRPSAPRHPVTSTDKVVNELPTIEELQKKDLKLEEYLKDVYVRSNDKVPQDLHGSRNNPERPLPESREPRPKATFVEPEEVEKGWCTITQISEFIASHEEDPVCNNIAAIAQKYSLEEKKVENTLKYFSVFRVFDRARDTVPGLYEQENKRTIFDDMREFDEEQKKLLEYRKRNSAGKKGESSDESPIHRPPVEKAINN